MSYVDTSIIVAALDKLDPRQRLAREVLEMEGDKRISELVLAELASPPSLEGFIESSTRSTTYVEGNPEGD
jgi:predicted nucleic acid-binding protein